MADVEKKFVSIVVYLHNDESYVESFLRKVIDKVSAKFSQFEIVCVDDACTDGTVPLVTEFVSAEKLDSMVSFVHMSYYQGLEASMNAGRDLAIGDFVYEFDNCVADYDLKIIDDVYEKLLSGYDVVSASPLGSTSLSSKIFYNIFNAFSRDKAGKLGTETLRIISRRAINRVKALGIYIPYRKAVYANCGLKTASVSYKRTNGVKKKGKTSERFSLAFDSFVYFTNALEKVSSILSGMFLLITIGIVIYILVDVFAHHNTADGWLSIMGFLSIGFFGVFVLLTIVLKYLSILISLVFRQQRYVVSDVEKIAPKEVQNK